MKGVQHVISYICTITKMVMILKHEELFLELNQLDLDDVVTRILKALI